MRPSIRLLDDGLVDRIVAEATGLLTDPGVGVADDEARQILTDHGATLEGDRVRIPETLVEQALSTAPSRFELFDATGERTHSFGTGDLHFSPGSAALIVLDHATGTARKPTTRDYVAYAKVVSQLPNLASQSTALIPGDVHEGISDSYRLYLSLLHCAKPVVTGTFSPAGFDVMSDLQIAVRGSAAALAERPLTVFTCCPTSPLGWSHEAVQPLLACARAGIPVEVVAMPLAGFVAPVTLVGTLVQHCAEALSGVVLAQLAKPGTPLLYGTSSAIFDVRYGTTPMGAIESMMLGCAVAEVGRSLGLPTQAYMALSDAKLLDAQAGLETGMGATLAALAGVDNCAGPGMLDYESCQSLEKLVLDHEVCGMAFRLREGITPRDDFPSLPHFQELLSEGHLLISEHSRRHLRAEHFMPGRALDRAPRPRWEEEGSSTLGDRAHVEVERLLQSYEPYGLDDDVAREMKERMQAEARRVGQDALPELTS